MTAVVAELTGDMRPVEDADMAGALDGFALCERKSGRKR